MPVDLLHHPFDLFQIPIGDWAQAGVDWCATHLRSLFQALRWPFAQVLDGADALLTSAPPLAVIAAAALILWQAASGRTALFGIVTLAFLGFVGVWAETMTTLAVVATSVFFCVAIGIPLGIAAARDRTFEVVLRPVLDIMQSVPAFVYLVPIAMLVGIGNVPGIIATMVFALPPIVRLTCLGIRNVPPGVVEAARVLGLKPRKILLLVELPLASKEIMAGVNQTIMMALAMSVVASMIAVDGLGLLVLRGIGSLDIGLATQGGLGIVLLAILLDRATHRVGLKEDGRRRWTERGPIGLLAAGCRLLARHRDAGQAAPAPDDALLIPGVSDNAVPR
jgi:glycine betaine/proline transport system permease protein